MTRRPFAYAVDRPQRRYWSFGCPFYTVNSRASRLRTRIVYRDLRRRGITATQARHVVCELLTAGQSAITVDELPTITVLIGTDMPHMRHQRKAVPA